MPQGVTEKQVSGARGEVKGFSREKVLLRLRLVRVSRAFQVPGSGFGIWNLGFPLTAVSGLSAVAPKHPRVLLLHI